MHTSMTAPMVLLMSPGDLEIDEHALFAQRLQERRQAARDEELEAYLEERDVVERLHDAQGFIDRGNVERNDEAFGASASV